MTSYGFRSRLRLHTRTAAGISVPADLVGVGVEHRAAASVAAGDELEHAVASLREGKRR
jgi:hypothetical protein